LQAEFSRRQIVNLLEKAVMDRKLPDTLLFQFESCVSWPFTKAQEKILLSYATAENLKKSAGASANTVKSIGKMAGIRDEKDVFPNPPPPLSIPNQPTRVAVVHPVREVYVSHEPRYTKGEWERVQKAERDREVAKLKAFPKEQTLNKFYRKIEIETG
jgi:hypothetical protein